MKRWTNPLTWSGHSVGMLAYLLLFPGFFFYHTLQILEEYSLAACTHAGTGV